MVVSSGNDCYLVNPMKNTYGFTWKEAVRVCAMKGKRTGMPAVLASIPPNGSLSESPPRSMQLSAMTVAPAYLSEVYEVRSWFILQLCDHKTCRMCSQKGRNGFSPHKNMAPFSTKGLEKSSCDFTGTILPFLYVVRTLSSLWASCV